MTIWRQASQGLWFGSTERPFRDEFDGVLTLSDTPPRTDDGVRHRHLPLPDLDAEIDSVIDIAVAWLEPRWRGGKTLLVQSPGCLWAEFVLASLFVHLGATADEAILSLQQARPLALTQPPFPDLLRAREVRHA